MTDEVAKQVPAVQRTRANSVLVRMAERFGMDARAFELVVRATVMPSPNASNEHLAALLLVADQYKLNPLTKQIYAFPAKGGGIVPVVGVDGWYYIANEHPEYDGCEQEVVRDEELGVGLKTTIHRKDRKYPAVHTAWLSECYRATEPWKMKMRMLGHKSFIQCARVAFSLSGIYDEDEAERIRDAEVIVASQPVPRGVAALEAALDSVDVAEREPGADEHLDGQGAAE